MLFSIQNFDTLSFDVLISKLCLHGITDTEVCLLISYLTNRKQYVVYSNYESDITKIIEGVLQGSILGTLFFSIIIDDLINISTKHTFLMYADYATTYFNLEDFTQLNMETGKEYNLMLGRRLPAVE